LKEDYYYVIKIASGFYQNIDLGMSPANGLMLLFSQKTGELISILLDEGYLTNIRTAIAGAIAAKYLAPKVIDKIGVFGAGIQGRLQVKYLQSVTDCKDVMVWGMNQKELILYQKEMEKDGYRVQITMTPEDIAASCNLIITATPSKTPLLHQDQIRKGTHITAMGADTPEKNELDPKITQKADIVVADSVDQCIERGEIHQSYRQNLLKKEDIFELGDVITTPSLRRSSEDQITIADLTGVAVQDIQITKEVYEGLIRE
jgi:ornithine cyclodeaminase